ncbi:hypothetical protein H6775_04020, partial [Candidatus Nomurabacteria bacterium]|nr:hypothetical protein [Candidatus Nomurabacteria bacterium]
SNGLLTQDSYLDQYYLVPSGGSSGCGSFGCGDSGSILSGGTLGCGGGYFGGNCGGSLGSLGGSLGFSNNRQTSNSNASNRSSSVERNSSNTNSTYRSTYTFTDNSDRSVEVTDNSIRTYSDDDIIGSFNDSHDDYDLEINGSFNGVPTNNGQGGIFASNVGSYYVTPTPISVPTGTYSSLSSVYLSEVPYTGAKETLTLIGYIALIFVWSALVVYFIAKRRGQKTKQDTISAFKEANRLAKEIA